MALKSAPGKLKIGLDLTALQPVETGVDQYLKQLVIHLGRVDRNNEYVVFLSGERADLRKQLPGRFRAVSFRAGPRVSRLIFQQLWLPVVAARSGLDVLHSPSFLRPLFRGRARHLLTVHDMTFFLMPELHTRLRGSRAFRKGIEWSIQGADMVSVPSDSARQDLLAVFPGTPPDRVRVIPYGVDAAFSPGDGVPARRGAGWPERYILFVGSIEPRKNVGGLIESYSRLVAGGRVDEHLVLAGGLGWGYEPVMRQIAAPALQGRVRSLGYVPPDELVALYRGARLFVYPSRYEGFGFPPLEAMACGVPTIATEGSSLGENLRGAAELVPVGDVPALTAAMERLLTDEPLRAHYQKAGPERAARFRWENTARLTLDCYAELATRA